MKYTKKLKSVLILLLLASMLGGCALADLGCLFAHTVDNGLASADGTSGCGAGGVSGTSTATTTTYSTNSNTYTIRADGNYSYTSEACQYWDPADIPNCQAIPLTGQLANGTSTTPYTQYVDVTQFGQWYATGIAVNPGDKVNIMVRGTGYLCANHGLNTNNGIDVVIDAKNESWTPVVDPVSNQQINANKCDIFAIAINDPAPSIAIPDPSSSCNANSPAISCNRFTVRTCDIDHGSNCPPVWSYSQDVTTKAYTYNNTCQTTGSDTHCWYIRGVGLQGNIGNGADLYYINSSPNNGGVSSHTATQNGAFSLRIYDLPGTYADNAGGYNAYVKHYACPSVDGFPQPAWGNNWDTGGKMMAVVVPTGQDPNTNSAVISASNTLTSINAAPDPVDSNGCNLPQVNTTCSSDSSSSQYYPGCPTDPNQAASFTDNLMGQNQVSGSGTIWLRMQDCNGCYTDNSGQFAVTIKSTIAVQTFSSLTGGIIGEVKDTLVGASQNIFQNLTCTGANSSGIASTSSKCIEFLNIITALLTLYIIAFAISFLFGLIQISQLDFIIRLMKMGVIIALTRQDAWNFFYTTFFDLYVGGSSYLIAIMTGSCDASQPFAFVDPVLEFLLFDPDTIVRLTALIFTSIFGIVYFALIIFGVLIVIQAILKAMVVYIMSFMAVAVLLALAPVFIPTMLFEMTRGLFDQWLKYLFRYSFEPVLLIVGLAILSDLLLISMNNIMAMAVCWKCAIPITLALPIPGIPPLSLFCIPYFLPWGYDNSGGGVVPAVLGKFTDVMFFVMVAQLMRKYERFSQELVTILTGSPNAPSVTSAAGDMRDSITEALKAAVGMDNESVQQRAQKNNKEEGGKEKNARDAAKKPRATGADAPPAAKP